MGVDSPAERRSHDREGLGGVSETYFRPAFRKIPSDIEVPEGQMARFDCVVAGRPNPDLFWFRDGTEVLDDRLHKIVINEDGISSLIFDATARSDSGHYTCIARNRAGEDRFEVNLNVTRTSTHHLCPSPPLVLRNYHFGIRKGRWSVETSLQQSINVFLCGDYNYDSTSIRRPFDCLSKVIKVTMT